LGIPGISVVHNEPDMSEAQRQLQHAKEQLDLAEQYPGRKAANPTRQPGRGAPKIDHMRRGEI
jgi:hypothetical protein